MYLKRKIDEYLLKWKKDAGHKPLIVKGARQIGKTEAIKHFSNQYENVIEINFYEEPKYKVICNAGYSVAEICKNISRIDPTKVFIPNKTLIFFDEITDYPEIATSLKFFCIDRQYDVICSGSLLGTSYKRIESNSVGYKTDYQMFSMDFEEFLWAKGYEAEEADNIFDHMRSLTPFSDTELQVYRELFYDYTVLGGMPAVVRMYIESGNFSGTLDLQRELINDYKEDIRKYVSGLEQTRLMNTFNSIAAQLSKENKKFQFAKIASGARYRDYMGCIEWLKDAGIIQICYCLNFPELPLKGNVDTGKFKIYFSDTGLLIAQLDEEVQEDLRVNKNLGTYKGALYENMIGEALVKSGQDLFYYKRENSQLEEDFFMRDANYLIPIEVKANDGRTQSLKTLINGNKYSDITYGIKLANKNIGFENHVYTFPFFCAFLIKRWLKKI